MRWRDFDALPSLPDEFFERPRRVHFIGVGGIGMSALARVLHERGHVVSGSDAHESPMLDKLRQNGITVRVGHDAHHLENAEAVIWGSAITPDNPERAGATQAHIPQWHRAQLLAHFVNRAQTSIAVSGTHGKSTTSAMIAHILEKCGHNPTAILGAEYSPFGSNVRLGDRDLLVVEADESDGSFTLLNPTIAVVTNVEPEHLENYEDSEEKLWQAFELFARQSCHTVLNADQRQMWQRLSTQAAAPVAFSLNGAAHTTEQKERPELKVGVPGQHNRSNALAAIEAAVLAGAEPVQAQAAMADFYGVARRFERKGEANGVLVYDDYAHHPTEIESTLQAAREYLQRPLLAIFQPHRYSRTQQMGTELGRALQSADRVIVTPLYSAFEKPIEGISSQIVFDALRDVCPNKPLLHAEDLQEARRTALEWTQPGDAIFTIGAGDIHQLGPQLLNDLQNGSAQESK